MIAATKRLVIAAAIAAEKPAFTRRRSPKWSTFRKNVLGKRPKCAACGRTEFVELHHIQPYHLRPELELDITNVVPLCEGIGAGCHLLLGHLGDYRSWNPDIATWLPAFSKAVANRPYRLEASP